MGYISFPVEATPEEILADAYDYIKSRSPSWNANDGNLDVWILQAIASEASDLRELARDVPDDIFRYFGTLVGLPPIEAVSATVNSTWAVNGTAGYTIPAGTYVTIRDTLGSDIPFQTVTDIIIPVGSSATAAGAVTLSAVEPGTDASGIGGNGVQATLLDTLAFVTSVTLTGATAGGVDAETVSEYNDRLATRLQLLSSRPILPRDFSIMAQDITGVFRALAIDGYSPQHNLLSANAASIETNAADWANNANCTPARSTSQAIDGAASLSLTSVAAGNMSAALVVGSTVAVNPSDVITALASFRAAASSRACRVHIFWLTSANAFISESVSANVNDTTTGWTQASVTGTAPATAAKAQIILEVLATGGAAEVHYADRMLLQRGTDGTWVPGGTPATGVERMITVAAVDELGEKIPPATVAALDAYLEANRELNFIVNETDPTYTTIQVAYSAKIITGFDWTQVSAAAASAIQSYLSPAVWGRDPSFTDASVESTWIDTPVLRYNELLSVISNIEGINYVTDMQMGVQGGTLVRTDVNLAQPASLTRPGTITPTQV